MMMFWLSAHKRWCLQGQLVALVLCASAAKGLCQPPPYAGGFAPGAATGGPTLPGAGPAQFVNQPPIYSQPGPTLQNNRVPPYSAQPTLAPQPSGYGPTSQGPQMNGELPAPAQPFWEPMNPLAPPQPSPLVQVPAPTAAPLPQMVYLVAPKFWIRPDILVWWTKPGSLSQPMVTTGSTADAVPGALGQSNTQVTIGNQNVNLGYVGGVRLETGLWLDSRHKIGVEAGYFTLIQQSRTLSDQSDQFGNPLITRPVIDADSHTESSYVAALPGYVVGAVNVVSRSLLQGANFDGALNLVQTEHVRLDGLAGFRYLSLVESLKINDQTQDLVGGVLSFGGSSAASGDMLTIFDGLRVTNSFYGGSTGARLYLAQERWYFSALGKMAFGTVQERATLSGNTTLSSANGTQSFLPGGILVTNANMGHYYQHRYAVLPEGQFNLGYQLTPAITVRIGYSFIYLNNVARPGNQVSRVTNGTLVPSNPGYTGAGPSSTAFEFHTSSFWAQGVNLGLDSRF